MNHSALVWLLFNLVSIMTLSFYSMIEMACVSINKVRLKFYVSQGVKRAQWLEYLLHNPTRLFGTTLIGVNVATIVSSECARQFHQAIGIDPDWAPLTQVFIVLIFGELAPMFAARVHSEHMALLGAPIVYASSKILSPVIWILGGISRMMNKLLGGKETHPNVLLGQDELVKILEEMDEELPDHTESEEFNAIASNIFRVREKEARNVMSPLTQDRMIPSNLTVGQLRSQLIRGYSEVIIYFRDTANVVGIAPIRDLIRVPDTKKVRDYSYSPWFVTEKTKIMHILKQFRQNNENIAIVLDDKGHAKGILSMDDIIQEIFGKQKAGRKKTSKQDRGEKKIVVVDRTVNGDMTLEDFNKEFGSHFDDQSSTTLSAYLMKIFGHHPEAGEELYLPPFEFTVLETSILEIVKVKVRTKLR